MAVGANTLWLTTLGTVPPEVVAALIPITVLASLLPDIDTAGSGAKIHYIGKGMFGIFRGMFFGKYFHHRGLMHSVTVTVILFIVLTIFFARSQPLVPPIISLAYFSHPLIDGFNTTVGYLYPFNTKRYAFLPRRYYIKVDSHGDNILFFIASASLLLFFWVFFQSLGTASQYLGG
jgi:membrane-bound metal-dependent hydrolase YbcI (DUF457 family)